MRYQPPVPAQELPDLPPPRPILSPAEYEAAVQAAQALRCKAEAAAAAIHSPVFSAQLWQAVGLRPKLLGERRNAFLEAHGLESQAGPAGPYSVYPRPAQQQPQAEPGLPRRHGREDATAYPMKDGCRRATDTGDAVSTGRGRYDTYHPSNSRQQNGTRDGQPYNGKAQKAASKALKKARCCPYCSQHCSKAAAADKPLLACSECRQSMHLDCYVRHVGSVPGQRDAVGCPQHAKQPKQPSTGGIKVALKLNRVGMVKRSNSQRGALGDDSSPTSSTGKRAAGTAAQAERWVTDQDLDLPAFTTGKFRRDAQPSTVHRNGSRRPERQRSLPSTANGTSSYGHVQEANQAPPAANGALRASAGPEGQLSPWQQEQQQTDGENAGGAVSKSGRPTRAAAPAAGTLKEVQTPLFAAHRHIVQRQSSVKEVSKLSISDRDADEPFSPSTQSHSTHARHDMRSRAQHDRQHSHALTPAASVKSQQSTEHHFSEAHSTSLGQVNSHDWGEALAEFQARASDTPRNGGSSADLDDGSLALLLHQELNAPAQRKCTRGQRSHSFSIAKQPGLGSAMSVEAAASKKRKREAHNHSHGSPQRLHTARSV